MGGNGETPYQCPECLGTTIRGGFTLDFDPARDAILAESNAWRRRAEYYGKLLREIARAKGEDLERQQAFLTVLFWPPG